MPKLSIVGFSGNISRPSKTRRFVEHIVEETAFSDDFSSTVFDVEDLGPSFIAARNVNQLDGHARKLHDDFVNADLIVAASPTYKGSYTGLFKHFFDLIEPSSLRGKPVILAATGGGDRHSLIVEHQLRPLFGFFEALALPTAIYAADRSFADGALTDPAIRQRVLQAAAEARKALGEVPRLQIAAE